ncbi:DUF6119 family protein [Actinosynnema pretiosum]|nr:DUF6119 family protein [Actinosynnema pretiosum]
MRITLYLLRESVAFDEKALRNSHLLTERRLIPPQPPEVRWRLFTGTKPEREVSWCRNLNTIVEAEDGDPITTKSAGAVLLVQAHGRVFAVTFGTGFHHVGHDSVEPDFGLRVAANCVSADRLTIADARGLGKGKRNATSKLPQAGEMFAFGLLTDEEWIRQFGGDVNIPGFARSARGSDSLQLTLDQEFTLNGLPAKLEEALELYRSEGYKACFPFLDYFRRESCKETISSLEGRLTEAMRAGDTGIGFALPDEFGRTADEYEICHRHRHESVTELRTESVYEVLTRLEGWKDPLHSVKIAAYDMSGEPVRPKEELRRYVVGEIQHDSGGRQQHYATTAGAWFRINEDYAAKVDRYLTDSIEDITAELDLPIWDDEYLKEHITQGRYGEDRYNRHSCEQRAYALLDRDFYRGGAGEQVEICDQLTPDKKLICVKRMDGSDKMSHLFQQGSVSAQMIVGNQDYRAKLMDKMRELDSAAEFGAPQDWTVVYAVATSRPGSLKKTLPFFARAALRAHARTVRTAGLRVAIAKIEKTRG